MNKPLLGAVLSAFTFTSLGALGAASAGDDPPAKTKKKGKAKGGEKSCGANSCSGDKKEKKGGEKACSGDKKGAEKSCSGDKKGAEKSCSGDKK
jgi:hypothetical protein